MHLVNAVPLLVSTRHDSTFECNFINDIKCSFKQNSMCLVVMFKLVADMNEDLIQAIY